MHPRHKGPGVSTLGLFFVPTLGEKRYDITGTHLDFMDAHRYRRITTQRLTITLSGVVFQRIEERSQREGRSMSNLVAYLLERELCDNPGTDPKRMP